MTITRVRLTAGVGTIVADWAPHEFEMYHVRLIQTAPPAPDTRWTSMAPSCVFIINAPATYQVGVVGLSANGQTSPEVLSAPVATSMLRPEDLRGFA